MDIFAILLYLAIGLFLSYLIIKAAVKHAIEESMDDIKHTVKESIKTALEEYDWKKENK